MIVVPELRMTHQQRVAVIAEHCTFFAGLTGEELTQDVPGCPGWTIEDAVRHVSAFSASCRAWCETGDLGDTNPMAFNLARMTQVQDLPLEQLILELDAYSDCLANLDADTPVYGHLGVETAGWLSWHCAAEMGLHRHDVETALGQPSSITGDRAVDAVIWTTQYAYPMVLRLRDLDSLPSVRLISDADHLDHTTGHGPATASLTGTAQDLLLHLWRRPHGPVTIQGDPLAAREYSGLSAGR